MKIAIIGTSRQEWDMTGPYIYGVLGNCIDAEDGAMAFKLPPTMTFDKHKQVNRNPMMGMAPDLTWLNVEYEKARNKIYMGMAAMQHPLVSDPLVPADPHAGARQFAPMPMMSMIRTTSTTSFPGANLPWVNMRKHCAHGQALRAGTCQTINKKQD